MSEKILEVRQLATSFHTERGWQQAIDGVSFDVYQGEILGIVGESGCGKSVTSQSIMRLYDERRLVRYSGTVKLEGQSLLDIPFHKMQDIRGSRVSMIFQDALSSLNPVPARAVRRYAAARDDCHCAGVPSAPADCR